MERNMGLRTVLSVLMQRSFDDYKVRCSARCALMAATVAVVVVVAFPLSFIYASAVFLLSLIFLLPAHGWDVWQYSLQSALLGFVFVYSILFSWLTPDRQLAMFTRYLACLSTFHFLEFMMTAFTNPEILDRSSYLLDHSVAYWVAAVGSWIEFFIEYFFVPTIKLWPISWFGLSMVAIGEMFRKLAMLHARGGFTHIVARYRRPDHVLVTDGVYAMVRHPGYLGWMIWCVGTQVLLCNPVCAVIYAVSAWLFFKDRILDEERLLVYFFGQKYREYQKRIPLGIPFIQGYTEE